MEITHNVDATDSDKNLNNAQNIIQALYDDEYEVETFSSIFFKFISKLCSVCL